MPKRQLVVSAAVLALAAGSLAGAQSSTAKVPLSMVGEASWIYMQSSVWGESIGPFRLIGRFGQGSNIFTGKVWSYNSEVVDPVTHTAGPVTLGANGSSQVHGSCLATSDPPDATVQQVILDCTLRVKSGPLTPVHLVLEGATVVRSDYDTYSTWSRSGAFAAE